VRELRGGMGGDGEENWKGKTASSKMMSREMYMRPVGK
jgi:hypothetical protein